MRVHVTQAQTAKETLPTDLSGVAAIAVSPRELARPLLEQFETVVAVGSAADEVMAEFRAARGVRGASSAKREMQKGEALVWRAGRPESTWVRLVRTRTPQQRHVRKYAEGELPSERSFVFRGPENKLKLRAHNLKTFEVLADGVYAATWLHHLRQGDYSTWLRKAVKDDGLAEAVTQIEQQQDLPPRESRARIRAAIEARYTAPA